MSGNGRPPRPPVGGRSGIRSRDQAALVSSLGRLRRSPSPTPPDGAKAGRGGCELCGGGISDNHRHLLHLDERRIVCVCGSCWALRSGDPEYRPTGGRTLWLEDFELPDELWGSFQIPIGLAFFFFSGASRRVMALYPSPAGATESELELEAWDQLRAANPVLDDLEPDAEALIVNRLADPPEYALVPIDECYRLVGMIKANWQGISGGSAIEDTVPGFFEEIRARSTGRRVP